jgi:hypothetical protein
LGTVTCLSVDCEQRSVQRWHVPEVKFYDTLRPVPNGDGTIALVASAWPGSRAGYLIRCENHCV